MGVCEESFFFDALHCLCLFSLVLVPRPLFHTHTMTLWTLCQVCACVCVCACGSASARVQHRQKGHAGFQSRASVSVHTTHTTQPTQAALLVVNGLAVFNNDRCLEKWGLGHSLVGRGDSLTAGPGLLRRQVVEFLHAVTYLRGEWSVVVYARELDRDQGGSFSET